MLVEYTQFLFDNKDKENFVELAIEKLKEMLPNEVKTDDYALSILRLIKDETIYLPNNVCINRILRVVCKDGERVHLTQTEYQIIEILALNKGNTVTFQMFINTIWKYGEKDIVKVNISNLRRKLDMDIVAIKGIGYTIEKDPTN